MPTSSSTCARSRCSSWCASRVRAMATSPCFATSGIWSWATARPNPRRPSDDRHDDPRELMRLPIYLDYSATTPVDPRVAQKMIPYLTEHFGNPASRSHSFGWTTEAAVEEARAHVAALVNCDPKELVWTSGATESTNLALKGAAHFYRDKGKHLVTVRTEHKATLDTMRELEREGYEVTYLDVLPNGL